VEVLASASALAVAAGHSSPKIHAGERITQNRASVGSGLSTPPSAFLSPDQVFKVGFLISSSPGIVSLCCVIWLFRVIWS